MILRQFLHKDPIAVSYLLGCAGKGAAAIVDPVFPIEPYPMPQGSPGHRSGSWSIPTFMPITDQPAGSWPLERERITRCMPRPRPVSHFAV